VVTTTPTTTTTSIKIKGIKEVAIISRTTMLTTTIKTGGVRPMRQLRLPPMQGMKQQHLLLPEIKLIFQVRRPAPVPTKWHVTSV